MQEYRTAPERETPVGTEIGDEYNYAHFSAAHLFSDAKATLRKHGVQPGQLAPDFELPRADGGSIRLSGLRGKPVLLHFGSYT